MRREKRYEFIDTESNQLDDPVAEETAWEALPSGLSFDTFTTCALFELSPDRLTIFDEAQARRYVQKGNPLPNPLWHWLPSLITLLIVVLSSGLAFVLQDETATQILGYFCMPALCLFPLVTVAAIIFSAQLRNKYSEFPLIDRSIGSYWRSKNLQEMVPDLEKEIVKLDNVYALQLLERIVPVRRGRYSTRSEPRSVYEMNFVLHDASRVQVYRNYYVKDVIWADAQRLGSFLDVPVWNDIGND